MGDQICEFSKIERPNVSFEIWGLNSQIFQKQSDQMSLF